MDLASYLIERDGKISRDGQELKRLAVAVAISPYYLYMLALGHKQPGPIVALRISEKTKQRVSLTSMRPDIWPKRAA